MSDKATSLHKIPEHIAYYSSLNNLAYSCINIIYICNIIYKLRTEVGPVVKIKCIANRKSSCQFK